MIKKCTKNITKKVHFISISSAINIWYYFFSIAVKSGTKMSKFVNIGTNVSKFVNIGTKISTAVNIWPKFSKAVRFLPKFAFEACEVLDM